MVRLRLARRGSTAPYDCVATNLARLTSKMRTRSLNNPFAVDVSGDSVWVTCQPVDRVVRIRFKPLTGRGD